MRLAVWLSLVVTATATSPHVLAQSVDDDLRVYAVNVVKTPPLEKQFTGYGIYLGNGWFIQSSGNGVDLATLDGWYKHEFAWARRPLAEAGLEG